MSEQKLEGTIRIPFKQAFLMLFLYGKRKVTEQIKAVWLIILYLAAFQYFVLGLPIKDTFVVATGMFFVILGLTFFMEGLVLGLMPLGDVCGVKLPQKVKLPTILIFSFILGIGATFAEPAIGVLKTAGSSIKAWDAPLLFLILNKYSSYLVYSVGLGVGLAVLFGMLRFLYQWSLKPFIYVLVILLVALSCYAYYDPNLLYVLGVAWDCGAVTTGPVTVPLVLALGIGISRIVGGNYSGNAGGGFGVVTLASLFPVLTVILLGIVLSGEVSLPMNDVEFFKPDNRHKVMPLFESEDGVIGYALMNASTKAQLMVFENDPNKMLAFVKDLEVSTVKQNSAFGDGQSYRKWLLEKAPQNITLSLFGTQEKVDSETKKLGHTNGSIDIWDIFIQNFKASIKAIVTLCSFLVLVLLFILREKIPKKDEVFLGIALGVLGMWIFSVGIELGLSRLGNQVGRYLPSSYTAITLVDKKIVIDNFDMSFVHKGVKGSDTVEPLLFVKEGKTYKASPFYPDNYDEKRKAYTHIPQRGPLFGEERSFWGFFVVLLFAFMLGYGATLAEPALNALGTTVEELSIGTFKKKLLMQSVALGVGTGITVGIAKILWDLPLFWLLSIPYLLLLVLTYYSTENFTNIGWDSAGVTTGPITVPLVLAMGLGIGGQVGVVEGFGILSLASVYPILSVVIMGIFVQMRRKRALDEQPETMQ